MFTKSAFRYGLYAIIALAAFGAGLWVSGFRETERPATTGADALFAILLPDIEGKPQSLKQWRGKVLVVNFWATWCAPCRKETPVFVRMQEEHGNKGLQFVGISIDQADKTSEFSKSFGVNYPILIGTFDTVAVSQKAGNLRRGLPFTVILDRKGQIVETELGGVTREKLELLINPLL